MKILSIAIFAFVNAKKIKLDEFDECDNFGERLKIKGIRPVCYSNRGPVKWKWRCKLKCKNGNPNIYSVRPIKCKVTSDPNCTDTGTCEPKTNRWRPPVIRNLESLCEKKAVCTDIKMRYNLSDPLLFWRAHKINERQTRYSFHCASVNHYENGVVNIDKWTSYLPVPVHSATCTCNYNKPSNSRCKWSKIENSTVKCVEEEIYWTLNRH